MTISTITPLPTAPSRDDAPATFITRANAFLAAMVTMGTELNTSIGEMNTDIAGVNSDADRAESAADSAVASANFKGAWSSLTGALNIPASVTHNGYLWILLNNLADVTASEPGVSADWQDLATIPSQTGQAGKYLTTDGSSTSWAAAVPDQSGNAGKYLTTDGSTASWGDVASGIIQLQAKENITAGDLVQVGSVGGAEKCVSGERVQTHCLALGDNEATEVSFIGYFPDHDYLVSITVPQARTFADIQTWKWNGARLELVNSTIYEQASLNPANQYSCGKLIYDPSSSRMVCVHSVEGAEDLQVTAFTVNADGSISDINSAAKKTGTIISVALAYDSNAERLLTVYNDSGLGTFARVLVVDPSDNSVTVGAESTSFDTNGTYLSMEYDSTNQVCVAAYRGSSNNGTAVVLTIDPSDNTVTWSTPVVWNSGTVTYPSLVYDSNNDKLAIFYLYVNDLYAVMGNVASGVTFWSGAQQKDAQPANYNIASYNVAENKYYNLSSNGTLTHLRRFAPNSGLTGFDEEMEQEYSTSGFGDETRIKINYAAYDNVNDISYLPSFFEDGNSAFAAVAIAAPGKQFKSLSRTTLGTASTGNDINNLHILHLEDYSGGENSYLFTYTDSLRDLKCRVGTVDFSDGSITLGSEVAINTGTDRHAYAYYDHLIDRVVLTWMESDRQIYYRMMDVNVTDRTITLDTEKNLVAITFDFGMWTMSYKKSMKKVYAFGYDGTTLRIYAIRASDTNTLQIAGNGSATTAQTWTPQDGAFFVNLRDEFPLVQIYGRNGTTLYRAGFTTDWTPAFRTSSSIQTGFATDTVGYTYVPEFNIVAIVSQEGLLLERFTDRGDTSNDYDSPFTEYGMFATDLTDFQNNTTAQNSYQHFVFWDKKLSAFLHFYENKVYIHEWNGELNNTSLTSVGEYQWGAPSAGEQQTGYMVYNEANGCYMNINEYGTSTDVSIITVKRSAKNGAIGFAVSSVSSGSNVNIATTGAKYTAPFSVVAGADYYINDYGKLSESGTGTPFARAISSTELVIK